MNRKLFFFFKWWGFQAQKEWNKDNIWNENISLIDCVRKYLKIQSFNGESHVNPIKDYESARRGSLISLISLNYLIYSFPVGKNQIGVTAEI